MSAGTGSADDEGARPPALRVVRGDASEEEVAALLAVLGAVGSGSSGSTSHEPPPAWTDRRATVRSALSHGPGEWRASFWPR